MGLTASSTAAANTVPKCASLDEVPVAHVALANDVRDKPQYPPLCRSISTNSTAASSEDTSSNDGSAPWTHTELGDIPEGYTVVKNSSIEFEEKLPVGARRRSSSAPVRRLEADVEEIENEGAPLHAMSAHTVSGNALDDSCVGLFAASGHSHWPADLAINLELCNVECASEASEDSDSSSTKATTADSTDVPTSEDLTPTHRSRFYDLSPRCMPVRCTFVHFESPTELGACRRNLSAPPSIFRQRHSDMAEQRSSPRHAQPERASLGTTDTHPATGLLCDTPFLLSSIAPAGPAAPPPLNAPINLPRIPTGTEVEIDGLIRAPHFNGMVGVVESFDPDTDRYDVVIHAIDGASNTARAKVKGVNLRSRAPPPPCFAPTLSIGSVVEDEDCFDSEPTTPRWEEQVQVLGTWGELQHKGLDCLLFPGIPAAPSGSAMITRSDEDASVFGTWGDAHHTHAGDLVNVPAPTWWADDSQAVGAYGEWQYNDTGTLCAF